MNRLMNRFVIDEDEDYDLMKVFHLEQTLDAFKKGELAKGKGSYKMKYKIKCEWNEYYFWYYNDSATITLD